MPIGPSNPNMFMRNQPRQPLSPGQFGNGMGSISPMPLPTAPSGPKFDGGIGPSPGFQIPIMPRYPGPVIPDQPEMSGAVNPSFGGNMGINPSPNLLQMLMQRRMMSGM
jgi:hypothetical protein